MANTRHETTLAWKTDARGLRDARKEFEKTFSPDTVKGLNSQMRTMEQRLVTLAKAQGHLNTQMGKVKEGSEAYKVLERSLANVEKRARSARSAMASLQTASGIAGGGSGGGPVAPPPGSPAARGAFSQGFLQGISPLAGGYLQRGDGLGAQFAGQRIGAMGRRMAGTGMNRGAGMFTGGNPLSTLTAGIPVVGGLAQMAEGAVGQFLSYRQAQVGALPFAAGGFGGIGAAGAAALKARGAAIPGKLSNEDLSMVAGAAYDADVLDTRQDTATKKARRGRQFGTMDMPGRIIDVETDEMAAFGSGRTGLNEKEQRARRRRRMRAAVDDATNERAKQISKAKAHNARVSREGIAQAIQAVTGDVMGIGARVGMSGSEAMQAFGAQGRAQGVVTSAQFEQAQAARVGYGVDAGTSAQLFRGQRAGRGAAGGDDINVLSKAIGGAVALGLEGSEVGENLSLIAQLQGEAEQRGMKISNEGLQTMAIALSGGGMAGVQAQRVAAAFTRQAQGLAMSGPSGAEDIALLRAGGFQAGGGFDNYYDTLKNMEHVTSDPEMMFKFIRNVVSSTGGGKKAAFTLSRTKFGKQIGSLGGIEKLIGATSGGAGSFRANLEAADALGKDGQVDLAALGRGGAAGLAEFGTGTGKGGAAVAAAMGPLKRQAEIGNRLIGVGQEVSGTVQRLNAKAAELAFSVGKLHTILDTVVPAIEKISDFMGSGIEGFSEAVTSAIVESKGGPAGPGG